VELGITLLEEILQRLLHLYPEIQVDLILTDRVVDLLEEGIDVAIRTGTLPDSGLIAKKIGVSEFHLFASPSYLKKEGAPFHPRELHRHICLNFTGHGEGEKWELENGKTRFVLEHQSRVSSTSLGLLYNLTLKGEGIALLPSFMTREMVKLGKLIRVLPEWTSGHEPLSIVYPAQKYVTPKLKAFLECLSQSIANP
jgi:DNA-binding transcriptional LysR family regulator